MPCEYAPTQDRKGRALHPGDRVRIKLYPRGTAEGILEISSRARVMLPDGSTAPDLVVNSNGIMYGCPPPKGILKLSASSSS
jgi:hypothetical protein